MTPAETEEITPLLDIALERKRRARDGALRQRLSDHLIPGLPVDGDAREVRIPEARVGSFVDAIVSELTFVKEPFFDTVCAHWNEIAPPNFTGRPGRYREGHLFFYVTTSAQVFAQRTKLAKIKKSILALPGAPKANRLTLHLEVHGTH